MTNQPSSPSALLALAERVEQASGPDRELDAMIAEALGLPRGRETGWCNSENGDYYVIDECANYFTASLDAAMTLVPEGPPLRQRWKIETTSEGAMAQVWRYKDEGGLLYSVCSNGGATPALALTAAALRARAALTLARKGEMK